MRKSLRKSMATGCQKFITLPGPGCCLTKMVSRFLELLDLGLGQFRLKMVVELLKVLQKFHLTCNYLQTLLKGLLFQRGG
ncbi:hypothetical protein L423_02728 [Enterobacter roggenkampii]|nr:hypothetical protein L423_02728 [Enterobacter roggenkampii]